jgi:hypothetical protein
MDYHRSLVVETWLTGRLAELRILGLTGGDTSYDATFYVAFRSVVLYAPPPTREEALPFLNEVCRGFGSDTWELITRFVTQPDELFEECRKRLENLP